MSQSEDWTPYVELPNTASRPISLLLCVMVKIAKGVVLRKLQWKLIEGNILKNGQFGFRTVHLTVHQILRIVEHVTDTFNKRKSLAWSRLTFVREAERFQVVDEGDNRGIPQYSLLPPTFFGIFLRNLPMTLNMKLAVNPHDTAGLVSSVWQRDNLRYLQTAIDELEDWFRT